MSDYQYIPTPVLGAETIDAQQGVLSRVSDAATKGIPAAAISGALSIYNTFLDYSGKEMLDTAETIRKFDEGIGDYYEQHQLGVDVVGFIGTSIIPGTAGIKALKLAQSGTALGPIGRGLGFAASRKDEYLQLALKELGRNGGTVTADIVAAKRAQLGWSVADNLITSTAAELAIAGTMSASPLMEGEDAWSLAKNIGIGAVFGGTIGGVVDNIVARGILKRAQNTIDVSKRNFDRMFDPGQMNLSKADDTLIFLEQIVKQPDDYYNVPFTYTKPGTKEAVTIELPTADSFKAARSRSQQVAFDTLASKFNELAEGGDATGQAMHRFIYNLVQTKRASGARADDIAEDVRGYLQGVKRIKNISDDVNEQLAQPRQFFVNQAPTGLDDLFTEVKGAKTGKQAYYLATDDPSQIKFAHARMGYETAEEAFADGFDAVLTKAGKVSINPKSKTILKTPDMALSNKYLLDLETGSLSREAIVTGADLLKRNSDFVWLRDMVEVSGKRFSQSASRTLDIPAAPLDASVRFMWASKLDAPFFKNRHIEKTDFALLDQLARLKWTDMLEKPPMIRMEDGKLVSVHDFIDLPSTINTWKLEALAQQLNAAEKGYDVRHLAAHLGTSREWVEEAIGSNFTANRKLIGASTPTENYFRPQTVMLEWDSASVQFMGATLKNKAAHGANFAATVELSHFYNLKINGIAQDNAFRAALGEFADRLPDLDGALAGKVSSQGVGATTFGAANADYGRAAEVAVQETGKQVSLIRQNLKNTVIESITPNINAIRANKDAAAELGVLMTALRRDTRKYQLVEEMAGAAPDGTPIMQYRLVDSAAVRLSNTADFDGDLDDAIQAVIDTGAGEKIRGSYAITNKEVGEFLRASKAANKEYLEKMTPLWNASGVVRQIDPEDIYVPPVDTGRYPYHAFVVSKERVGAPSEVAMITAKDAEQLRILSSRVDTDQYDVVFKEDTKRYFKAKGQYDFSMTLNESKVNNMMKRRGVLGDFFPETRAQNVLEDYVNFHANSVDNLVRTAVQVKNRQFFSELKWLADRFEDASSSTFGGRGFFQRRADVNPFKDYISTALDISKRAEYPLLESLNEFVDRVGTEAYKAFDRTAEEFKKSKGKDLVSLERANDLLEQYGLPTPYKTLEEYLVANEKVPKNLIRSFFQKANLFLATATLRLDFANSLVNMISTPILIGTEMSAIKTTLGRDPELLGKLNELLTVKVPGQAAGVPSTTKLIGNAIKNFFGADKDILLKRYRDNGDIKDVLSLYHEALNDISYMPNMEVSKWTSMIEKGVEKGATITGNNFSEEFTRFVSADVMRQLTDPAVKAGNMSLKEQNSFISIFVNRTQGNYVSSQRPIIFQGTTGAAIGLFQTYAFNVMQQLFRHIENRNTRTLLTFAGLQSSVYGLNGLPFFDAINQHIIGTASGNENHWDAYTVIPNFNKEVGDWMLYGTASAFPLFGERSPALYSRGDLNPRHLSIIPINPMDIPAVSASIRLVEQVYKFGKNLGNGVDASDAMLQALEHQGWNRPLAGFAQVVAGRSTTSQGSLISSASEFEVMATLSRLAGAKPMDEAIALNALYRSKAYQAVDRARLEALGSQVKTKLYDNQVPDQDEMLELMENYAKAGGRIENFSSSMQYWMRNANYSVVNQMADRLSNPAAMRMQMVMGGDRLMDYQTLAQESE